MSWRWQKPDPAPYRGRIAGVWGTVHTTNGDFDTDTVTGVEISGERTTFDLCRQSCPLSGVADSVTLHVGALAVEIRLAQPERVSRGGILTVIQPVEMATLVARNPIRRDYR